MRHCRRPVRNAERPSPRAANDDSSSSGLSALLRSPAGRPHFTCLLRSSALQTIPRYTRLCEVATRRSFLLPPTALDEPAILLGNLTLTSLVTTTTVFYDQNTDSRQPSKRPNHPNKLSQNKQFKTTHQHVLSYAGRLCSRSHLHPRRCRHRCLRPLHGPERLRIQPGPVEVRHATSSVHRHRRFRHELDAPRLPVWPPMAGGPH